MARTSYKYPAYKVAEADLQNLIRSQLQLSGYAVFRCNVGSVKTDDGRWFSTGLPKGFSDLMAVKNGRIYFIEVKVKPNKPTPEQVEFIESMRDMGCGAGIAYSLEDAENIVEAV